jgi:selenocysteine lyase/cysteine desulfurase
LTAFSIEGIEPKDVVDFVREKYNLVIRTVGSEEKGTYGLRVSTHIYITQKHVDMLLEGIQHLVKRGA